MHGRGGEETKTARHMWTTPTRGNAIVNAAAGVSSSKSLSTNSFFKDGCKIRIGDCALFKPPEDCPTFIGIILSLTVGEENKLKLGVNWLSRPVEVKLGRGFLLEAEPNEIFYSFHRDDIPAASLLHPCKVAFLPKGVDLPSGISSFVCRRVYDIANKCLWWLTDQDYIHDRQEEVDKLLYKTRIEMHVTVQPGGRSPKPMSSPTSTSQLKPGSDGVPNSASSYPSQVKSKKRERIDQGSEPVKRERITKAEEGDSGHLRHDSILKTDIARIMEKGGLVDAEGVEKLVQLMVPDRNEKKIDLAGRSMLAAVIAATDKFDCLSQFVQLKGLPVLDEWLQEVPKRKMGDGCGSRGGDKSVEEFLLVLLRALDKLPVNLQALQTCNLGKSVNHLRTHKNSEIQKRARGLVDTWKKRVEAEISINDTKSGSGQTVSWSTKSRPPEVLQGGDRHSGGSSDVAMKSSVTQLSAPKTGSVKTVQGENTSRSASQGSMKSVPLTSSAAVKDGQLHGTAGGGTADLPMANTRDEKSSSSSQSHNGGQSCSSNHAKAGGFSGKEDARSSTAMSVNKISGGSSRHRKSINGFPGSTSSGGQRETVSSRNSSMHKNPSSEKLSILDGPAIDGNTHKLIVKIPKQGRSPAQSASGDSVDDLSIMNSRASSPALSEKYDQFDRSSKEKSEFYRADTGSDIDTEYWQSNDFKDVLTGSVQGDGSPANTTDEERPRTADDSKKMLEVSKATSSSSGNDNRAGNLQDVSFSSINALIESCVNYSEANASVSVADDVGMNLLASVAAAEISKSVLVTPAGSPERHNAIVEQCCEGADKLRSSDEDLVRDECHSNDSNDDLQDEHKKLGSISHDVGSNNDDNDSSFLVSGGKAAAESHKHINTSSIDLQQVTETCLERKVKENEKPIAATLAAFPDSTMQEARDSDNAKQFKDKKFVGEVNAGGTLDVKVSDVSSEIEIGAIEKPSSCSFLEIDVKGDDCTPEGLSSGGQTAQMPPVIVVQSDLVKRTDEDVLLPSGSSLDKVSEDLNEREARTDDMATDNHASQSEKQRNEQGRDAVTMLEDRAMANSGSGVTGHASDYVEENKEAKEVHDQNARQMVHRASPEIPSQDMDHHLGFKGSKLTVAEAEAEECTSTTADASPVSAAGVSNADAKVEFDLNEGFNADDGKSGEFNSIVTIECMPTVRLISPVPFPASSMSSGIAASITVAAAAAKGPFVPPEDLLKSKGELGWKGSAATSAFRPAEPRKVTEIPVHKPPIPVPDAAAAELSRSPLDIDLNVPDERIIDDLASESCARLTDCVSLGVVDHDLVHTKMTSSPVHCYRGLGLDLNHADEVSDMGNSTMSNNHKMDEPLLNVKSSSGGPPNSEMGARRDFDLNDGPAVDDVGTEPSFFPQQARSIVPSQTPIPGLRICNAEPGNFSSWLPSTGNTYPAVTVSSIMPNRDQPFSVVAPNGPQRILGPTTDGSPFGSDAYRGPVLSSSHAVPYPSAPYQYPVFPFNSSFPLPSASFSGGSATYVDSALGGRFCFPAVNSQLLGPAGTVSSHFSRPFVVSLPDNSNSSSAESNRKWARQSLDLNAGPGCPDTEGRDENSPLVPKQLSVASSQALAEEQGRTFQLTSGILKRKEPDVGWDSYKQSSWQ